MDARHKDKINYWCWNFIRTNKRLPVVDDLTGKNGTPDILQISRFFGNLPGLIDACAPSTALRTNGLKKMYTFGELRNGFLKYKLENDRFPTIHEINECSYLPSARTIERSWGGLAVIRAIVGADILHYGRGQIRSDLARKLFSNSIEQETLLEKKLIEHFGEIFVHNQKRIGNVNVDFLIYSPEITFGIDIFDHSTAASFSGSVNHKQKVYADFPHMVIFVPANEGLSQAQIDEILFRKKIPLSDHCRIMSMVTLDGWISKIKPYTRVE